MADPTPPVGGEVILLSNHATCPLTRTQKASPIPSPEIKPDAKAAKPLKPPNPMWKYLGFGENFRPRVPSRNWLIFLTITGGFTAAVVYDKRETKRAQRRWCKLVEHIAQEPLDSRAMPRKLTVFLESPPTDGLRIAQDHFKEYVKPVLVASGLDWEFIQGRKEGDIRAELAEKIRQSRLPPDQRDEDPITEMRRNTGIKEFDGPRGDIVLGRHTWKEYIRGLHEGWLGPLTEPPKPEVEEPAITTEDLKEPTTPVEPSIETLPGITIHETTVRDTDTPSPSQPPTEPPNPDKPKKPPQPSPYILPSSYPAAPTPPDLPPVLDPSTPIPFPHILGFLNTPLRLYRFLNRRVLADTIGRDVAAIILCNSRPYHTSSSPSPSSLDPDFPAPTAASEQELALAAEEKEWHKSVRVRVDGENERTWLDPIVLDERIASRMRRCELSPEDEEKAARIVVTEEEIEGWIKGGLRSLGREALGYIGFGKARESKKPLISEEEDVLE